MKRKSLPDAFIERPLRIIQFGNGSFARGVLDRILQDANENGADANCVIVRDKPAERNLPQHNRYALVLKDIKRETTKDINCISSVIDPYDDYNTFSSLADNDQIKTIFWAPEEESWLLANGKIANDKSHPLYMLTMLLFRRFCLEMRGFTIIAATNGDFNGNRLKQEIIEFATMRQLGMDFINWLGFENTFINTYIQCRTQALSQEKTYSAMAEKYLLCVLSKADAILSKSSLVTVDGDIKSYYTINSFVYNGALAVSCAYALLHDIKTVDAFMNREKLVKHMTVSVFEEIIPALDVNFETLQVFTLDMLKRFENNFFPILWKDYAKGLGEKFTKYVVPIIRHYVNNERPTPKHLVFALFCTIQYYRAFEPDDDFCKKLKESENVLADKALWGCSLTALSADIAAYEKRFASNE